MLFKNIITTTTTRLIATLATAVSVLITARLYGADGRGQISLFILGITITNMFSSLVGGGSIVYLIPRSNLKNLYALGLIWSILSSVIVSAILLFFQLIPEDFAYHVVSLSIIQNILQLQQNVLLGKNKIRSYNTSQLLQSFLTVIPLVGLINYSASTTSSFNSYIYILYAAYLLPCIISYFFVRYFIEKTALKIDELKSNFYETLQLGYVAQIANIAQLISYRFNFYLLNNYVNTASVGVYSTAVMFIDSILIIAKSIALNLYSSTANTNDNKENITNTIRYSKMAFWLTILALLIFSFIPIQLIEWLFGKDFNEIKSICIYSCIGIFSFSLYVCYSHYFAGIGQFKINRNGSMISALATIITGLILVPLLGINGAIASSVIANFLGLLYLGYQFKKQTATTYLQLIPTLSDWKFVGEQLRGIIK